MAPPRYKGRGIAPIAIALAIVLLIVAAAAAYIFFFAGSGASGASTSHNSTVSSSQSSSQSSSHSSSQSSSSTTDNFTLKVTTSTTSTVTSTSSSQPSTSTSNTQPLGIVTIIFRWTDNTTSSGSNQAVVADGEFTIDLTTGTGVATATGTIKYDISGVCKGSESLNYTFLVVGAVVKTTNNLTLAAQVPSPATSDAPVVCNGTQSTVAYSWTALGVPMVSLRAAHGGEAFGTAADGVLAYFVEIE